MLQYGSYDVLELLPPTKGMNRNVSEDVLTMDYAVALENILPRPLGYASVRFGTELLDGVNLDPYDQILESFPFIKENGDKQILLYVAEFVVDLTSDQFQILTPNSFSFTSDAPLSFEVDTYVKIEYSQLGNQVVVAKITKNTTLVNTVTLTVENNIFPNNLALATIDQIYFSIGSIYAYDFATETIGGQLITGLSVACIPRGVTYLNALIICNGVNRLMVYDGNAISEIVDYVKEDTATSFIRIDNNNFSFVLSPLKASLFNIDKYADDNEIQIDVAGVRTTTTVTNIQSVIVPGATTITVTTAGVLPAFDGQNQPTLFYRDWPPRLSFLTVAYDRLWGLGEGASGLAYRDADQSMRVFFSYQSSSYVNWFNETTKTVPSIDLSRSHDIPDNLEAISLVANRLIFLGRNKSQLWSGSEPLGAAIDPSNATFQFDKILPIGVVNGNLVLEMPNDIYFVSQTGLMSLGSFNQTTQFGVTSSNAVDPLINEYLKTITSSNSNFRACRSFKYKTGSFCGFKIGKNKTLISLYSTAPYAWSLFSGDFLFANSFLTNVDNSLYLVINNRVCRYADGVEGLPVYGDSGYLNPLFPEILRPIEFLWSLPKIHSKGRRFANKRYELEVDYLSSFVLDDRNNISITIDGDSAQNFMLGVDYTAQQKGDPLGQIAFFNGVGVANENDIGYRMDIPYSILKERLKFVSSKFTVNIEGSVVNSPFNIKNIKLFGIFERG